MFTYRTTSLTLLLLTLLIAALISSVLTFRPQLLRAFRRRFRWLARRPKVAILVIAASSLALNAGLATLRFPLPWIHDEYSYLLASDTFTNGRLSNPTHPLWQHFESFHVLSQPTYASKYPPAQGLALAAGQRLTGLPIVGVWFSLAAACSATYWMLRRWTVPSWALAGGLAVTLHAPMLRAWGQSYWGGAVAMLGGALVFGAIRGIVGERFNQSTTPRLRDVLAFGVGLLVLANSRPAEGFLTSLPVFFALSIWFFRSVLPWPTKLSCVALPLVCLAGVGVAAMAYYNVKTTGSQTTMAYKLHDQTYSASSLVLWKTQPPIPTYNHARMANYYLTFGRERALELREPATYLKTLVLKLYLLWDFFPLGMGLGLLAVPWLFQDAWMRLALLTLGLLMLVQAQLASSWIFPHYLAPAASLFYAVNTQGLRRLYHWHRPLGRILTRAVWIALVLKLALTFQAWQTPPTPHPREIITQRLAADPTSAHLVLVSYAASRSTHQEYVYNEADIDAAAIVWARDMGPEANQRLFEYYPDRKIWRWHLGESDSETWEEIKHVK